MWRWPSSRSTIKSWKNMFDMEQKVSKALDKNKEFILKSPTSLRSFSRGDDNTFVSGESEIGKGLPTEVEVASSAIAEVKYNPQSQVASLRFVGGDKWYDYQVTPDEFKDFIDADSKGRWVNYVWKFDNRMPGY